MATEIVACCLSVGVPIILSVTIPSGAGMSVQNLILLATTYGGHRGLSVATVGTYAALDGKFFRRLSEGAGCTFAKAARVTAWFDENWPADLEWPKEVPRPSDALSRRKRRAA